MVDVTALCHKGVPAGPPNAYGSRLRPKQVSHSHAIVLGFFWKLRGESGSEGRWKRRPRT